MKTRHKILPLIAGLILYAASACMNPADPLSGTSWKLTAYDGAPLIPDTMVTIEFSNGSVGGSSGCNTYGGTYQLDGKKLQISELVSTLMACAKPEGVMEQEAAFLNGLLEVQAFELKDDQVEITTSDGTTLTFMRKK